jgi:hypothetical protein
LAEDFKALNSKACAGLLKLEAAWRHAAKTAQDCLPPPAVLMAAIQQWKGYDMTTDKETAQALALAKFQELADKYDVAPAKFWLAKTCKAASDKKGHIDWLTKAAEQGMPVAMFELADHYYTAETPNFKQAAAQFEQAAKAGLGRAAARCGYMYEKGLGVDGGTDKEKALFYYKMAAIKGVGIGMRNTGICYQEGIGCNKDLRQAAHWFERAFAKFGEPICRRRLDEIQGDAASTIVFRIHDTVHGGDVKDVKGSGAETKTTPTKDRDAHNNKLVNEQVVAIIAKIQTVVDEAKRRNEKYPDVVNYDMPTTWSDAKYKPLTNRVIQQVIASDWQPTVQAHTTTLYGAPTFLVMTLNDGATRLDDMVELSSDDWR